MRNAIFAVRGRNVNPDSFNWKTFNANVHELKQTMLAIQEGFKAFIFWEARGIRLLGNVAALFLFQFMISFPTETIALLPMAVLIGLLLEYWSLTDPSPIATRLTAVQMFITLLCGLAPPGLIAHPSATQEESSDGGQNEEGRASEEEEDSEEEDSDDGKYGSLAGRVGAKVVAVGQKAVDQGVKAGVTAASAGYAVGKATVEAGKTAARASLKAALDPTSLSPTNLVKKTAKVAGRVAFPVMTVKASLQDELDRLKREVDDQIFDAVSRSTQDEEDFSINPLASILGPIQKDFDSDKSRVARCQARDEMGRSFPYLPVVHRAHRYEYLTCLGWSDCNGYSMGHCTRVDLADSRSSGPWSSYVLGGRRAEGSGGRIQRGGRTLCNRRF